MNDVRTNEINEADGYQKNVEKEHTTDPMVPLTLRKLKKTSMPKVQICYINKTKMDSVKLDMLNCVEFNCNVIFYYITVILFICFNSEYLF